MDRDGAALIQPWQRVVRTWGVFRRFLPWCGAALFLGAFFFYPLARILGLSLDGSALDARALSVMLRSTVFTFSQALLSTLLTFMLGIPAAVLFSRFAFPGRSLLRALTAIPFLLPTVVVASGFTALLGERGWVNLGLMRLLGLETAPILFIGTLGAILAAHVFYNTTIVIRILGDAFASLDPRMGQTASSLGASPGRVFWNVTLPVLRPALLAAVVLVFMFDFTSFGVVLLLGAPRHATLEVEIFRQSLSFFNLPLAAWLALLQLLFTLAFALIYSRMVRQTAVSLAPRSLTPQPPGTRWQKIFVTCLSGLLLAYFMLPLISLPLRSMTRLESDRGERSAVQLDLTLDFYRELFRNQRGSAFYVPPVAAIGNSLLYACLTVVLSLALGFPVAVSLRQPGRLERLLDPLFLLPLGASAVSLGLGLIVAYGRLLTYPWAVPLAHTMIALPFVIRTLQPALASIPIRLRHAAATLGASPLKVWWEVDWIIIRKAVLSAAIFAFTVSLGEFGATALIYRPEYPTLPVAIYRFLSQPGALNYGQAMSMATLLMLVAGTGILVVERLRLPGKQEF
jgi:thiamine transport system permease protein